jgi:NAD(P)H-hydrate epimerase
MDFVDWNYREGDRPATFDADALFALAVRRTTLSNASGPRVLTPHAGEFARLTNQSYDPQQRVKTAVEFVRSISADCPHQLVLVLKGHETIVTDGHCYSINHTGNPGMATGGTGDVLTGVITALLCQGLSPFDAARLGVHVHGLAGDLAAAELGQVSLIATDVIDYLPKAFQSLEAAKS